MKQSLIPIVLGVMTISVPVLYLLGYFYHLGYLSVYGLSNEFMSYSIYDYLVQAFVVLLQLSTTMVNYLNEYWWKLLLWAGVVALTVVPLVYLIKHLALIVKKARTTFGWKYADYVTIPSAIGFIAFFIPYSLVICLFALCVIPITAYWQGERYAGESIRDFGGCELDERSVKDSCLQIISKDYGIVEGDYIAQSSSHIAIWNGVSTEVVPVKDTKMVIRFGKIPSEDSPRVRVKSMSSGVTN